MKDKLGVTDEEIADAMQKLGLTVADLIQPNQLAQLTAELTDVKMLENCCATVHLWKL